MKTVGRLILSAIFLVLTGVMVAAARSAPDAVFAFRIRVSISATGSVICIVCSS